MNTTIADWALPTLIALVLAGGVLYLCGRFRRVSEAVEVPSTPQADPWPALREQLPAKLEWAATIDVAKLAQDASSTPEKVEAVTGYPGAWLRFGELVQLPDRPTLVSLLEFGAEAPQDLLPWLVAYARSADGFGLVPLGDFLKLNNESQKIFGKVIGIERYILGELPTVTSLRDYWNLAYRLDHREVCPHEKHRALFAALNHKKDQLLRDGRAACHTVEDLVAFHCEIGGCPPDNPYWRCGCDARNEVSSSIHRALKQQLELATTPAEVDAVDIPMRVCWCAETLQREKDAKATMLREHEETARIQAAMAMS